MESSFVWTQEHVFVRRGDVFVPGWAALSDGSPGQLCWAPYGQLRAAAAQAAGSADASSITTTTEGAASPSSPSTSLGMNGDDGAVSQSQPEADPMTADTTTTTSTTVAPPSEASLKALLQQVSHIPNAPQCVNECLVRIALHRVHSLDRCMPTGAGVPRLVVHMCADDQADDQVDGNVVTTHMAMKGQTRAPLYFYRGGLGALWRLLRKRLVMQLSSAGACITSASSPSSTKKEQWLVNDVYHDEDTASSSLNRSIHLAALQRSRCLGGNAGGGSDDGAPNGMESTPATPTASEQEDGDSVDGSPKQTLANTLDLEVEVGAPLARSDQTFPATTDTTTDTTTTNASSTSGGVLGRMGALLSSYWSQPEEDLSPSSARRKQPASSSSQLRMSKVIHDAECSECHQIRDSVTRVKFQSLGEREPRLVCLDCSLRIRSAADRLAQQRGHRLPPDQLRRLHTSGELFTLAGMDPPQKPAPIVTRLAPPMGAHVEADSESGLPPIVDDYGAHVQGMAIIQASHIQAEPRQEAVSLQEWHRAWEQHAPTLSRNPTAKEAPQATGHEHALPSPSPLHRLPTSLRRRIFLGGVAPEARRTVWPVLLGFLDGLSGAKQRAQARRQRAHEYHHVYAAQWQLITPEQASHWRKYRDRRHLIEKDVVRTDRTHAFFAVTDDHERLQVLERILTTYSFFNFDVGYCQGMNDYLSIIMMVMYHPERDGDGVPSKDCDDSVEQRGTCHACARDGFTTAQLAESDSFWCFKMLMDTIAVNFHKDQTGMGQQLRRLQSLISCLDPPLYSYLRAKDADNCFMAFRWILLQFKREFKQEHLMTMWECFWTSPEPHFHLFAAAAMLLRMRDEIMSDDMSFDEMLQKANHCGSSAAMPFEELLTEAETLRAKLYHFYNDEQRARLFM